MPGKRTLGSMINPRPMQFTMGAKMYQNGRGTARSQAITVEGVEVDPRTLRPFGTSGTPSEAEIANAEQIAELRAKMDTVAPFSEEEEAIRQQILQLRGKGPGMESASSKLSEEQKSRIQMLQNKIIQMEGNPFRKDDIKAMEEEIRQIEKGGPSSTQTPGGVPAPLPTGPFSKETAGPMPVPSPTPDAPPTRKTLEMGRLLKEYLKGGKSEAGLRALAESNPNLTYKEATAGVRLIKDPVGMKSAGHGRKMYQDGTGSAEGGGQPERIDPNDPGFQEFLKATSGSYPYYPEYTGDPIGKGSTIKGRSQAGFDDVILGQHGMGTRDLAVNPELYTFPTSVEGPSYAEGGRGVDINYLQGPQSMIPGTGRMFPGATGDPATAMTRGDAIQASIEKYEANLAAEQAYRDYLAKQKKGPAQPVRYESTPDGGFRVIGTQSQIDATNPNR